MKLMQCFPTAAIRSLVMATAAEEGIEAREEGLCVHFAPPKSLDDLTKIRRVLSSAKKAAPRLHETAGTVVTIE